MSSSPGRDSRGGTRWAKGPRLIVSVFHQTRKGRWWKGAGDRTVLVVTIPAGGSGEYDVVPESALVEELEVDPPVRRQRRLTRTDDHWPDEQLALVNQPGFESLRREVRTS